MVDQVVLNKGNGIGRYPVDKQPGGKPRDERGEGDGHKSHHPPLSGGDVPRGYPPGDEQDRRREHWQYEVRVSPG